MALSPDLTLDELRLAMAGDVAAAAVFDGWSAAAVASAAEVLGVNPAVAAIAFEGSNPSIPATHCCFALGAYNRAFRRLSAAWQ